MDVPFLDLKAQNRCLKKEILPLWEQILEDAWFIGGEHVCGLEKEFADACGVSHCISVNSGTDALRFILIALGIQPGDEVITVPNTFIATTEAISQAGAVFRFVDIDPGSYNMAPGKIESAITAKTKGILPVHLYGQPADMTPIREIAQKHSLWVVEDACQAHLAEYQGQRAGSMGIAAAFSFYPGKNMGACGEAGAVTTNDDDLAKKIRMLRDHGQAQKYYHDIEGFNGRCDALQAAALRVKLRHLPEWTEKRRQHAMRYRACLAGYPQIVLPTVQPENHHVYHLFVIQTGHREKIQALMAEKGVSTGLHYPVPLHLQKAYQHLGYRRGDFPVTEACAERLLSLPMYAELTDDQIQFVCDILISAVQRLA